MSPERTESFPAPGLDHGRARGRARSAPPAHAGLGFGIRDRRMRVAPARRTPRLAHAAAAPARAHRRGRHGRCRARLLDDHRSRRRHGPARPDVRAEAARDEDRARPHGTDLHRLVPVPRGLPLRAGRRDRGLGAVDGLAARRGAASRLAPRYGRPRAAALPHDRGHAPEGGPGRARPVLLLPAGRGQFLGRAVLRARTDRTHRRNVARRHFRPHAERRRRLPRALRRQSAAAAAALLARPRILAVRRLYLVARRRAVFPPSRASITQARPSTTP